jgi:hypothetical protein
MTWDEHYDMYCEARQHRGVEAYRCIVSARKRIGQNSPDDWQWLIKSLSDPERKWFVASVFQNQQIPKRLFVPMLRAGVLERNPSFNRWFIDPCVRSCGAVRVCTVLLSYLKNGSNEEKAGAVSALYWGLHPNQDEDISELLTQIRAAELREFVQNEDLRVRQRLIPMLSLNPNHYSEELRPLIPLAIEIARTHPDKYIRHRVEVQLGGIGPLMPIPDT